MSTSKWTPKDLPNLDGRTVLITGATSGIGRAAATELAGAGARVVMAVRNTERGEKIASELGNGAEARKLDLDIVDFDLGRYQFSAAVQPFSFEACVAGLAKRSAAVPSNASLSMSSSP